MLHVCLIARLLCGRSLHLQNKYKSTEKYSTFVNWRQIWESFAKLFLGLFIAIMNFVLTIKF